MAKGPEVGEEAPEFELEGTDGSFRLSEHRGERIVLLFYPGDDTPVCTRQFCSYAEQSDDMGALEATVVGISQQDVASHTAFREKHSIPVPLLADTDGAVGKAYGLTRPVLGTQRGVVIVDEAGKVVYRHEHTLGLDFQTVEDLQAALASLPAPA